LYSAFSQFAGGLAKTNPGSMSQINAAPATRVRETTLTLISFSRYASLVHPVKLDGSRAERELGLRYTSMEETVRRTLAWYAERGLAPPLRDGPD